MIVFDNTGSWLHQMFGAEYSSLSSAADCESLAEKPLKLRYNFISRCPKADYPQDQRIGNTELKSYHGYGSGQGDKKVDRRMTYYVARFYDFRKKL